MDLLVAGGGLLPPTLSTGEASLRLGPWQHPVFEIILIFKDKETRVMAWRALRELVREEESLF
jgi:hypothetical protein